MEISYNKLWKLLIDKGMNKTDLRFPKPDFTACLRLRSSRYMRRHINGTIQIRRYLLLIFENWMQMKFGIILVSSEENLI